MIKLEHISKEYRGKGVCVKALKNINLIVRDGEMIAIMGASGSGKTTLLNIIGCMDSATDGIYQYLGEQEQYEIDRMKYGETEKYRKKHIGFVFQQFALLNNFSVYQNVEMPLRARRVPEKQRKELVMNALKKVGIEELSTKYPAKISGGQQQRCAIARAIVADCDIILADEPTGALDSKTGEEIMKSLTELKKEGKTIIVVTHDRKVAEYADRIVHIRDGVCEEEIDEKNNK